MTCHNTNNNSIHSKGSKFAIVLFFYYDEPHLQYKPPKHKKKKKFPASIQYKTRYKNLCLQPEESKDKNHTHVKKVGYTSDFLFGI